MTESPRGPLGCNCGMFTWSFGKPEPIPYGFWPASSGMDVVPIAGKDCIETTGLDGAFVELKTVRHPI